MNEEGGGKKKKAGGSSFDITTVVGLILAIGLVVFGIIYVAPPPEPQQTPGTSDEEYAENMAKWEQDTADWELTGGPIRSWNLNAFIDIPSIAITIGGTIAALLVSYPMSIVARVPKWVKICFVPKKYNPQDYISQVVDFAREARVKGLLSLEDKLESASDPFLKSSLMLVVDSVEPEKVHNLLQAELDKLSERHAVGKTFMESGGAFAPGFGMIGTLIGLINMLKDMSDASAIGPAMAVALITTLYGSLMANVLFSPAATTLQARHDEEYLCRELICEGVEAIQAGENPKFIEEKLNMLIAQKKGKKGKAGATEAAAEG